MENVKEVTVVNQEFAEVHGIITQHRIHALQAVNLDNLQTAWEVGKFISVRLHKSTWGRNTVMQSPSVSTLRQVEQENIVGVP